MSYFHVSITVRPWTSGWVNDNDERIVGSIGIEAEDLKQAELKAREWLPLFDKEVIP